jgi:hypothetical protein
MKAYARDIGAFAIGERGMWFGCDTKLQVVKSDGHLILGIYRVTAPALSPHCSLSRAQPHATGMRLACEGGRDDFTCARPVAQLAEDL